MSCIYITGCQLACSPAAFPAQAFQFKKTSKWPSTYLGTKFPKIFPKLTSTTYRYRQATTICLFGGKGNSGNDNEASPWKALEKAVGNFKKDQSIEDVLKQQIQKQEYYDDGGSGGKPPGGGGRGDGSGEAGDEGSSGMWDEFVQVILATVGFIFLYIYILQGEEVTVLAKDFLRLIFKRQVSLRLQRIIEQLESFLQRMKEKREYEDPNWLEREIINTTTWYDSPAKYRMILEALESRSDDDDDDDDE